MYFLYTSKNIPLENHRTRPGMVANAYDPSNSGGGDQEDHNPGQTGEVCETLFKKITKAKRAASVDQVVGFRPSKDKASRPNTNPSTAKKKKKKGVYKDLYM
jgi:hypothetical protein